jgi:hypothetical protein
MTDLIERTFRRLADHLPGRVSRPGDDRYAAATAIWQSQSAACRALSSIAKHPMTSSRQFEPHATVVFRCRSVAAATTGPVAPCARESLST